MTRNYRKKRTKPYDRGILDDAIRRVKDGQSVYCASKHTGVPKTTLLRHCQTDRPIQMGRPRVLSDDEELRLVEVIIYLSKVALPLDSVDIRRLVQHFLNNLGRETRWDDNLPSYDWVADLKKRHPNLTSRKPEILTLARAKSFTRDVVDLFFQMYEAEVTDVLPTHLYNLDETGLSTNPLNKKVFVAKDERSAYLQTPTGGKTMYSVLFCASAAGEYLPPFIIYKAKGAPWDTWMKNGPKDAVYGTSESGWMEDKTFESWFRDSFLPFIRQKHNGEKVVVTFDGHGSHLTFTTAQMAKDENITLICLPPHSSHALQPLDVGVFGPLKRRWADILKRWQRETRMQAVGKTVFPSLLARLCSTLEPAHAVAGFRGSGLFPVDKTKVSHRLTDGQTPSTSVNLPAQALQDAVLSVVSPTPSAETQAALDNKKARRKRVQAKAGEVLTAENALQRLEEEKRIRDLKKRVCKRDERLEPAADLEEASAQESSDEETVDITEVKMSDFLVVKLKAGSSSKTLKFIAQVTELTEDIVVSFLRRLPGSTNKFVFPPEPDVASVDYKDIEKVIESENVIPDRRGLTYFVRGVSL